MGFNYLFIFPPSYVALCGSKARQRVASERVSWCLETSLFFKTPFLGHISIATSFVSLFIFYIFFLSPFEDNGLLFWVPDVLCRHSEVVLWNLFSVQCSYDEFVGEKVVSPSHSSAILGLPP